MVVSFDPIVISSRIWRGHLPHFFRAHVRHRQWRTGKDSDTSQQARSGKDELPSKCHGGRAFAAARSASDDWPLPASQRARPAGLRASISRRRRHGSS